MGRPGYLLALIQAPIIAIAIGVSVARGVPAPGEPRVTPQAVAAAVFWLGLAAIWFGLSDAVLGGLVDAERLRGGPWAERAGRLLSLAMLCVIQCVVARIIVAWFVGLQGPWTWALALLALASAVGLAAGLLIVALAPRPRFAWAALGSLMVLIWLFGGGPGTLPRALPGARPVANLMPSRWVFEGLLLLESTPQPPPATPDRDLAETYFPAASERMGDRADLMAIASMLIGLSAAATYVLWATGPDRRVMSGP